MATRKQTSFLREKFGDDFKATVYYIDIRAIDRLDDFNQKMKADPNVKFIKSKVASDTQDKDQNVVLNGADTAGYHRYSTSHDLVVLPTGMVANAGVDIDKMTASQVEGQASSTPAGVSVVKPISILNLTYRLRVRPNARRAAHEIILNPPPGLFHRSPAV